MNESAARIARPSLVTLLTFALLWLAPAVADASFEVAQDPSGIRVKLNQHFYEPGDALQVTVHFGSIPIAAAEVRVVLAAPSGDVEELVLTPSGGGSYAQTAALVIAESDGTYLPEDDVLEVDPEETFVAILFLETLGSDFESFEEDLVSDEGFLVGDPANAPISIVDARLAASDDENVVPPGGKVIGTILHTNGIPIQFPLYELIFYPKDQEQLDQFMIETGADPIGTNLLDEEVGTVEPSAYLVVLNPDGVPTQHLGWMRKRFGETDTLIGSNETVLKTYAMALYWQLEGYAVAVNPRMVEGGQPRISEDKDCDPNEPKDPYGPICTSAFLKGAGSGFRHGPIHKCDKTKRPPEPGGCAFEVPKLWAFNALWDGDDRADGDEVELAFVDQGMQVNPDFGEAATIQQCDVEGTNLWSPNVCGPGVAESLPTSGNSFFGEKSWHGNHMVSVAAARINNDWGAAGVGGQVVKPALYRMGISSYAFEMGLAIKLAALNGASCVNVSAGYPCTPVFNIGPTFDICTIGGRLAFCAAATATLAAAATVICGAVGWIPLAGTIACTAAQVAFAVASSACLTSLVAGDIKSTMQAGVEAATDMGVPVVSIAGNALNAATIGEPIASLVDISNTNMDHWGIIPGVFPTVIAVGAAGDDWPIDNTQFHGASIDIWAHPNAIGFAPPTTTALSMDPENDHRPSYIGSSTSAATAFVSGVISAMQALNENLDPQNPNLTTAQRQAIPQTIKNLLVGSAYSAAELEAAAPEDIIFGPAAALRINLISPLGAMEAASVGYVPGVALLEYSSMLSFDEDGSSDSVSTEITGTMTGSVIFIPGERSAPDYLDQDTYHRSFGGQPGWMWDTHVDIDLVNPSKFGMPEIEGPALEVTSITAPSADEERFYLKLPTMHSDTNYPFSLRSVSVKRDNVYKIHRYQAYKKPVPPPDRFDQPQRPPNCLSSQPDNDTKDRAVALDNDSTCPDVIWVQTPDEVTACFVGFTCKYRITLPDLNFHDTPDQDWFSVQAGEFVNGANDVFRIEANADVEIEVYYRHIVNAVEVETLLAKGTRSLNLPNTIAGLSSPLLIKVAPPIEGMFLEYDLEFSRKKYGFLDQLEAFKDHVWWSKYLRVPRDFPFSTLLPDEVSGSFVRLLDDEGRITTPDEYELAWQFQAESAISIELHNGNSLKAEILDGAGALMASAEYFENSSSGKAGTFGTAPANGTSSQLALRLDTSGLEGGNTYSLRLSHAFPGTEIYVSLPDAGTAPGQVLSQSCPDGFCRIAIGSDTDGDDVPDSADAFPLDSAESLDTDRDGIGNNGDLDDDDDGYSDAAELEAGTDPLDSISFPVSVPTLSPEKLVLLLLLLGSIGIATFVRGRPVRRV